MTETYILGGAMLFLLFAVVAKALTGAFSFSGAKICTRCEGKVSPEMNTPGSIGVELLLWLFFILPGLFYSAWRLAKRGEQCPSCGSEELVPTDSPKGEEIIERRRRWD